uniref:TIR domain-containing protein n=1 Tax=Neogobius melanostomus TaxID=47308 RepID=A0A8C6TYZ4_9GOBI
LHVSVRSLVAARALKMSQPESDPGTGVKEVIDLLLKAPPQRLCSLTFQLGPTIEEDIVHALCLFIQQRVLQALEKLQAHSKNVLAKHLLEKWQRNTRNIEEYKVHCGDFQESESLVTLARVFKVLTQHGLCDRDLLYLAYKRAFPCESSDSNVLEYNHFIEEAKQVCGPEIVELLGTFTNFKLVSGSHSKADAGNPSATTGLAEDHSWSNVPSPLQSTSSVPSFPSHLEISLPSTDVLATPGSSITRSQSDPSIKPSFNLHGQRLEFKFPNQPTEPTSKPSPEESFEAAPQEEPEQEEDMKEKVEDIIKGDGATFSNEFEVPGKYTISCIEDAINNSAFTFLLLTTNFNSFLEMKTNSALINSIQNPAKRDTVIPLLPQSNAMPKEEFPMVLKTLISLMESNKHFEKKIQQVLNPKRIKCQREEWMKEQKVKMLKERQEKLKISNQQQVRENEEYRNMIMLEQQRLSLFNERYSVPEQRVGPDGRPWSQQQQPPQINITNARYIIIGDNSQMAVDISKEKNRLQK